MLRRISQAELAWVIDYIPRWSTRLPTVTHPSTNRAQRYQLSQTATSLATSAN